MGRSSRRALLALLLVALIGLGSAACRGATGSETPVADRAAPVATPPGLLPTPTLAAPGSETAATSGDATSRAEKIQWRSCEHSVRLQVDRSEACMAIGCSRWTLDPMRLDTRRAATHMRALNLPHPAA